MLAISKSFNQYRKTSDGMDMYIECSGNIFHVRGIQNESKGLRLCLEMWHNKNPHKGNYSFVLTDVRNCSSYIPRTETFLEIGRPKFVTLPETPMPGDENCNKKKRNGWCHSSGGQS